MNNFVYKLFQSEMIQTEQEALDKLCSTLTDDSFLNMEYWDDPEEYPHFWNDIKVFCDKWEIPFNVNLYKNMRKHLVGEPSNDWQSSDNCW